MRAELFLLYLCTVLCDKDNNTISEIEKHLPPDNEHHNYFPDLPYRSDRMLKVERGNYDRTPEIPTNTSIKTTNVTTNKTIEIKPFEEVDYCIEHKAYKLFVKTLETTEAIESKNQMKFQEFKHSYTGSLTTSQRVNVHILKQENNAISKKVYRLRKFRTKCKEISFFQKTKLFFKEEKILRHTRMVKLKAWWMLKHAKYAKDSILNKNYANDGNPDPQTKAEEEAKIAKYTKQFLNFYMERKIEIAALEKEFQKFKITIKEELTTEERNKILEFLKKVSDISEVTRLKKKERAAKANMDHALEQKCEAAEADVFLDMRMLWLNCADILRKFKQELSNDEAKKIPEINAKVII